MTDQPDPRTRAAEWRSSATRLRRAADRIDAAIARPHQHPWPEPLDLRGAVAAGHLLAVYAARPTLGRAAASQYRDLADAHEHRAVHLTRSTS